MNFLMNVRYVLIQCVMELLRVSLRKAYLSLDLIGRLFHVEKISLKTRLRFVGHVVMQALKTVVPINLLVSANQGSSDSKMQSMARLYSLDLRYF